MKNADLVNGNSDILLEGFSIDGQRATQSGDKKKFGIYLSRTSGVRIRDIEVANMDGTGIRVTGDGVMTRDCYLENLILHDNAVNGLDVMYRMRNVFYARIRSSANGQDGFYIDHSEGIASDIAADHNGRYGIYIHNVQGSSYSHLCATDNLGHGIYVLGMLNSLATGWRSQNNGSDLVAGSDVYFSGDVAPSGYGVTDRVLIANVLCGANTSAPVFSPPEAFGLYLEDPVNGDVRILGVSYGPVRSSSPYRVPSNIGRVVLLDFPLLTNRVRLLSGEMRLGPGVAIGANNSVGSRVGVSPSDRIGFWGSNPIPQPAGMTDTSGADLATLEGEVNRLKALLRAAGMMSP